MPEGVSKREERRGSAQQEVMSSAARISRPNSRPTACASISTQMLARQTAASAPLAA
jgi:hypothetical protein